MAFHGAFSVIELVLVSCLAFLGFPREIKISPNLVAVHCCFYQHLALTQHHTGVAYTNCLFIAVCLARLYLVSDLIH